MCVAVDRDKTSHHVCSSISKKIKTLPKNLAVSLTWDRGKELAARPKVSVATGVQVYFCNLRGPCQRGGNENTNGLSRQYPQKFSTPAVHSQRHLDHVPTC